MHLFFKTLILCLLLLTTSFSNAQTLVGGGIYEDTRWTKARSPYIVVDNITVIAKVVLTIEPGVTVRFEPGTSIDLESGKLVAIGNAHDSIIFTSNADEPAMGDWQGFIVRTVPGVLQTNSQVSLEYARGSYAETLFMFRSAYESPYTFRNCRFTYNQKVFEGGFGMDAYFLSMADSEFSNNYSCIEFGYQYTLARCRFINNNKGILKSGANLSHCRFERHTEYAISGAIGNMQYCKFINNDIAIKEGSFNSVFVHNSIIGNRIGIELISTSRDFKNNTFCNNQEYDLVRVGRRDTIHIPNNCWCTLMPEEAKKKIKDGLQQEGLGFVIIEPLHGCTDDQNRLFSLSGRLHGGDGNIAMVAIHLQSLQQYITHPDVNGQFNFEELPQGSYLLQAENKSIVNAVPIYYPGTTDRSKAHIFQLIGDIIEVDLHIPAQHLRTEPRQTVHPNPFQDKIKFSDAMHVVIRDLRGNNVFDGHSGSEIDTRLWEAGVYFIYIPDGNVLRVLKL